MGAEGQEQARIIEWAEWMTPRFPELALLFHIPNGGARDKRTGAILKREGVKAGVPDLFLPVPRGDKHGLFIELKAGRGKPSEKQLWWIDKLNDQGYMALVCWGADEAIDTIMAYLRR